jgi:hypothetical protein
VATTETAAKKPARGGRRLSDGSVIYWWFEILMCQLF